VIRPYRPSDLPELRRICLLTGRAGTDATGQYSSDELLPDVFLEPYVALEPETAWTVELGGAPVGYLLATLDTAAFVAVWESSWAAEFARRHPVVVGGEEWLHDRRPSLVEGHPAHLHIDLLPSAQRGGWGRALLRQLGLARHRPRPAPLAAPTPSPHRVRNCGRLRAL
jgi:hypothetical protein